MILILINSDIGKKGNIGFRTGKVIENLHKKKIDFFAISRGNKLVNNKNIITMGLLGTLSLFINFLRIYFFPKLDASSINNKIYEYFVIFVCTFLDKKKIKIIYTGIYSKKLTNYFKNYNIKTITDVSMAPYKIGEKQMNGKIPKNQKENEIITILNSYKLIAPSEFVQNCILKIYKKKSKVINFASSSFYKKNFHFLKNKKQIKFCFVGLVNERKGINYLLKVWANNPIFKKHQLILCGRVFKNQKNLINKVDADNIVLTGFTDPTKIFKNADIFVFPSLMEGSAKAVFEAMGHSLPVITTKEAGSIVDNKKNGIIIKAKNYDELKKAMKFFILNKNYIKKFGKNAYNKSKQYTWKNYSDKVVNILINEQI